MLKYIFLLLGLILLGLSIFNVNESAKAMDQNRKRLEEWAARIEQKTSQQTPLNSKDLHGMDESIEGLEYSANFIDAKNRNTNGWWGICIGLLFSCTACFEFFKAFWKKRSLEQEAEPGMESPIEEKPSVGRFWKSE